MIDEPEISRERVIAGLLENVEVAMGRKPVKRSVWRSGKLIEIEVIEYNPAAACRALELLGKEIGMFKERHEITEFSRMSDEELAASLQRSLVDLAATKYGLSSAIAHAIAEWEAANGAAKEKPLNS